MNALTLPAGHMKDVLTLTAVIAVSFVLLAINPTKSV
jgi:hypothetical protein